MKKFNILCLLMACALIFVAVSCVNAADVNDTSVITHDDSTIPVSDQVTTPATNQTPIQDTVEVEKEVPTTVTVTNDMKTPEKDNHGSMTELKNQLKFIKSGKHIYFHQRLSVC